MMFCSKFCRKLDIFCLLLHHSWCCALKGFCKVVCCQTHQQWQIVRSLFLQKVCAKFCWCQLPRVSIWSQESYKLSRLAESLASREKSLELSWSSLLPRPPWVNLSFYLLFLLFEGRRRVQDFLVLPQEFGSFPSVLWRAGWRNLVCGVFVDDKVNGGWFLFYWRLMLLWVMVVGFENIYTVSGKLNITRVLPGILRLPYIISWAAGSQSGRLPSSGFPISDYHYGLPINQWDSSFNPIGSQYSIPALWNLCSESVGA